jgi:hypothetical protein
MELDREVRTCEIAAPLPVTPGDHLCRDLAPKPRPGNPLLSFIAHSGVLPDEDRSSASAFRP